MGKWFADSRARRATTRWAQSGGRECPQRAFNERYSGVSRTQCGSEYSGAAKLQSSRSSDDIMLLSKPSTTHKDLEQPSFTIIFDASDAMKASLPARPASCGCTARPRAAVKTFKLRVLDLRVPRGTVIQKLYLLQPYRTCRFICSTGDWVASISISARTRT